MRDWQRQAAAASAAFRAAEGDVEFQTDGTAVNTVLGWREMRLSNFAKRRRGKAVDGREDWEQRDLPAPQGRDIQAGLRSGEQLGPAWRRMAARLGLRRTEEITAIANGARWIWRQLEQHLPGAVGVLDIYHASAQLWAAAHRQFGDGSPAAETGVEACRATLLRKGATGLLVELTDAAWSEVRGYFAPQSITASPEPKCERNQW